MDQIKKSLSRRYYNYTKKRAPAYCCLKQKGYDILRASKQESAEDSLHYQLTDKVAKIIIDEIKEHLTDDFTEYPASDRMFEKARRLPNKLKYLLNKLILNEYKKKT